MINNTSLKEWGLGMNGVSSADIAADDVVTLRVGDLMAKNVATLNQMDTMATAAELFAKKRITGAPVCNDFGHCVGVLSSTDFVRDGSSAIHGPIDDQLVGHFMTTPAISVTPDTPLSEVAFIMCRKHIHRLPVVTEDSVLVGVFSSMDVVAAVFHIANSD
jgi:CBS domain-containing membrane protein